MMDYRGGGNRRAGQRRTQAVCTDLIEILLDAYEELMASVPVQTLLAVHQRIEANFDAPIDQRRSIRAVLAGDPL